MTTTKNTALFFFVIVIIQLNFFCIVEGASKAYLQTGEVVKIDDYSLEHLSIVEFEAVNATLVAYNPGKPCPACLGACTAYDLSSEESIPKAWLTSLNGKIAIVATATNCEVTVAVRNIVKIKEELEKLAKKLLKDIEIVAVLELHEPLQVLETNDAVPRYTYDPYPIRREGQLIVNRAHGKQSGFILRSLMGCEFKGINLNETVSDELTCEFPQGENVANLVQYSFEYTVSPWYALLGGWMWSAYALGGILLYLGMGVHCIKALIHLQKKMHGAYGSSLNLQHGTIIVMSALVCVRIVDFSVTIARDVCGQFVPELIGQLFWIWGYVLACIAFLMLVLYWVELVRVTSRKLTKLSPPSERFVILFSVAFICITTVLMVLFSMNITNASILFLFAATGLLAITSFSLAIGLIVYANKIVKKLNVSNLQALESSSDQDSKSQAVKRKKLGRGVKKIRPLTRLTMVSAMMIIIVVCLVGVTFFSPALEKPDTSYVLLFIAVGIAETVTYGVMIYTISPLTKKRHGQDTTTAKTTQLSRLRNDAGTFSNANMSAYANTTENNSYSGLDYFDHNTASIQENADDSPYSSSMAQNVNRDVPKQSARGFRVSKFFSRHILSGRKVKFEDINELI